MSQIRKAAKVLRTYFLNSTIHGFRYLVERDRHWSERIFWLICCVLSWLGTSLLLHANWDDYRNNAIQFVADTTYLDWDTQFPSITVCETENQVNLAKVTDRLYGDPHDYNLDEVVQELVFYKGLSFYTLQICGDPMYRNPQCNINNFSMFSGLVRSSCSQVLRKCSWNNEDINCCEYFRPMNTELGLCYSINSKQTREENSVHLDMRSNRQLGPGRFYMEIQSVANVYLMGEQEVPTLLTIQSEILSVRPQMHYHRYFTLTEIDNQAEVRNVEMAQRNCRFMDENNLTVYTMYSYSACSVQCRKDAQLSRCNCVHHLIPTTKKQQTPECDIEGLKCLAQNQHELAVLKSRWTNRDGIICDCLPSCTEIEITVIRDEEDEINEEYAVVELSLERLPAERFKRSVVKGKLDLVVSMGGTTALFLGASILSIVEFVFYLLMRPITDSLRRQRLNNNDLRVEKVLRS